MYICLLFVSHNVEIWFKIRWLGLSQVSVIKYQVADTLEFLVMMIKFTLQSLIT